jgi:hypothetical protein
MKFAAIIACVICSCAYGQSAAPPTRMTPNVLEYSKPQLVQDIEAASTLTGPFGCDRDGSIFATITGYLFEGGAANPYRLALLGIHSDGSVTDFSWHSVPGFNTTNSFPKSFFVGNDHVYLLVDARPSSGTTSGGSHTQLVLALNKQGGLDRAITLEPDLHPVVFGVFRSGRILVIFEEPLNHRMALKLIDANGTFIRDIQLSDSNSVLRASKPASDSLGDPANYSPHLLISMIKLIPSGDHLLLVPLGTSDRPIVELDENGIVSSVIPQLPDNMVLDSFISSDESSFKVQLGRLLESTKKLVDSQGKWTDVATAPRHRITEISRRDGHILRELELAEPELLPVCEADNVFHLLAAPSQGRLQVSAAQAR